MTRIWTTLVVLLFLVSNAFGQAPTPRTAEQKQQLTLAEELTDKAFDLEEIGKAADAIPLVKQALNIHIAIHGNEHADTARSLHSLGFLHWSMGDHATARTYYERALRIRRKVLGNQHLETSVSLNNLGTVLRQMGDDTTARKYVEESLDIVKKVLGKEHPDTVNVLLNLGSILSSLDDHATARSYYEEALRIQRKFLGDHHPATAKTFNDLGVLLEAMGNYAAARPHFEYALQIRKKVLGLEHSDTAASLNNLGGLLHSIRECAAARPYYEQALQIKIKVLGEEHPSTATSLNNLGILLCELGDYAAARPYYEQALQIRKKVFGDEHPTTARSLNNVGFLLKTMGEFAAARPYCERALQTTKKVLGDEHPATSDIRINLGGLYASLGEWTEAVEQTDQALRSIRRQTARILPALSEKEQLAFLQKDDEVRIHHALSLGWLRRGDLETANHSCEWLLNGKGLSHECLAERAMLARDERNPQSAALVNQLLDVRRRLAQFSLSISNRNHESGHRQQWDLLLAQENQLSQELAQVTARPELTEPWAKLAAVRQRLTQRSRLIDIARFQIFDFQAKGQAPRWKPARYVAWVIPQAGIADVQIVDLGDAKVIDEQVEQVRQLIAEAGAKESVLLQEGEPEAVRQLQERLAALAKQIWSPLAPHVADAETLFLSPDASLWFVPWGALPTGNEDKFLIEKFAINYLVSGRDLVKTSRRSDRTNPPTVFANPDFDLTPADVLKQVKAILRDRAPKEDDAIARSLTPAGKSALPKVAPLPGTAQEAEAITPLLKGYAGEDPQVYTAKNSLESVVKAIRSPRIAVLATHGFFLSDQEVKRDDRLLVSSETRTVALTVDGKPIENPLLRCGLLFAGCNAPGAGQGTAGDDGVLTGLEIVGLDLRGTELVVLSACETGIGQVRNGEGVAGLRQAFQLAGAQAVVATLWQIPDVQSARLMNDFFTNLAAGQSKGEALRNAQLKQIRSRREKFGAAHPFFWAAFTLTGRE